MSQNKKLIAEIERTVKKIGEGIELFDTIWDKLHNTTSTSLKERFQSELKTEIKKLQRMRDQIKTWQGMSDVRDKRAIEDARRQIEAKMEQFKACEREAKIKTFSKIGLSLPSKEDPEEVAREGMRSWINSSIDQLKQSVESAEADLEAAMAKNTKRKRASKGTGETEAGRERISTYKFHIGKLEAVMRMLDNDKVTVDEIEPIQEIVNMYIDHNMDKDYDSAEMEGVYDCLLPDDMDAFPDTPTQPVVEPKSKPADEPVLSKREQEKELKKRKKKEAAAAAGDADSRASTPTTPSMTPPSQSLTQQASSSSVGKSAGAAAGATASAAAASSASSPSAPSAAASPAAVSTPTAASTSGAASGASTPTSASLPTAQAAATSPVAPTASKAAAPPTAAANYAQAAKKAAPKKGSTPTSTPPTPVLEARAARQSGNAAAAASAAAATTTAPGAGAVAVAGATATANASAAGAGGAAGSRRSRDSSPSTPTAPAKVAVRQQAAGQTQASSPSAAAPAGAATPSTNRPMTAPSHRISDEKRANIERMLQQSHNNVPTPEDTRKRHTYMPPNPYQTASYYPQEPHPAFENPETIANFDPDTLFFIFYYQQNTYQQYLAAKELKKKSWRFHKRYQTWFQRADPPIYVNEDYEQGNYVYFDYEDGWSTRLKNNFIFKYTYLEDELVTST